MKGCRLLQDFLLPALRKRTFGDHLKWDPTDPSVFMLKWTHKAKSSWTASDAAVFVAWDRIKRRPTAKTPLEFVNSKQRLRAALRNVKTVEEVDSNISGYRKYRVLDMADLLLTQRLNGGNKKVKQDLDTEKKPDIKSENEKKPLIKQEKIKLDEIRSRSRTAHFSRNRWQNKDEDDYNEGRIMTRSLRTKKPVKYEEIDVDDDDDENDIIYYENNVSYSNDGKVVIKPEKQPIRETRDIKTHLKQSHNYNSNGNSEEYNSARKVVEDWHLQNTYNCYENYSTEKVKVEPAFYKSLMNINTEKGKINTGIIYDDKGVERKLIDKNMYHIHLMDIEKRMSETGLYHKGESAEQKMKVDEAFHYTIDMTDLNGIERKLIGKKGYHIGLMDIEKRMSETGLYHKGESAEQKMKVDKAFHYTINMTDGNGVERKLADKNMYHIGLMDIEKRMSETGLYHKGESGEKKMKVDEAFHYTIDMMDKVTEKSKTDPGILKIAAWEHDYFQNQVMVKEKEKPKIDFETSTNAAWEDNLIKNVKKEPYDPYAHLPWTYTKLEEKYNIPPITETLPDKIFESDSDDEIMVCSEFGQKNDDSIYLSSNEISEWDNIVEKIITNEELSQKHITEDASCILRHENVNTIEDKLEVIDELIMNELKNLKETDEVSLIEPRMFSGVSTLGNASNTFYQTNVSDVQKAVDAPDVLLSLDDKYLTDLMSMDSEKFYLSPPFNWKLELNHF